MPQEDLDQWYSNSNNWDWVEKAMAWDDMQDPALAASEDAALAGPTGIADLDSFGIGTTLDFSHNDPIISCATLEAIPPGKAAGKILKCGIKGCTSTKLFDRKYELQRHMETHEQGAFPCTVLGCKRGHARPFKRLGHLRNHLKKIHGLEDGA